MKSTTKAFWKLVSEWCAELSEGENALLLDGAKKMNISPIVIMPMTFVKPIT